MCGSRVGRDILRHKNDELSCSAGDGVELLVLQAPACCSNHCLKLVIQNSIIHDVKSRAWNGEATSCIMLNEALVSKKDCTLAESHLCLR